MTEAASPETGSHTVAILRDHPNAPEAPSVIADACEEEL
jgi:hypothetical protein